ncbi:MAG: TIM barrel protein [Oleiphilaceae bacterium]|nr:TIM barrel protein [Oleiphilaceae bacterium]
MILQRFKTLWGHQGTLKQAIDQAKEARFDGLEAPLPGGSPAVNQFAEAIHSSELMWIQEICTAGGYVPRREASVADHLADFERQLRSAQAIGVKPEFVNVMGGCDAWPIDVSVRFFSEAADIAARLGVIASFETHRGRSFFSPWNTLAILERLPHLEVTCDFSHWAVVSERLPHIEWDCIEQAAAQARHIHTRVGYDQGPQVPHPAAPEYAEALNSHQRCWEAVWKAQADRGLSRTTMTPEFGPDGYLHHLPFTDMPIADLWELNQWIGNVESEHFSRWLQSLASPSANSVA